MQYHDNPAGVFADFSIDKNHCDGQNTGMTQGTVHTEQPNLPDFSPVRRWRGQPAPMALAAGALMLGIVSGRYAPLVTGVYVLAGAIGLGAAMASFFRDHLRPLTSAALAVVIFCAGAVHVRLVYFQTSPDDVLTYTGHGRILSTLRGQIETAPQILVSDANLGGYHRPPRTCFLLECREILTSEGWRAVGGLARVTIKEADRRLFAGQSVELVGSLGRIRGPDNPGQYNAAQAARDQHVMAAMSVERADAASIRSEPAGSWLSRAVCKVRALAREHWAGLGAEQDDRLLDALIIGERHPSLQSLNRTMMQAGVVHFMSISGSHLAIFLGFVYLLCRLASLTPRRSAGAALAILVIYIALAEPNAPLYRSAIMAGAVCLAVMFRRSGAAINALSLSAVILLIVDPLDLFSAGFQLSFALVAGMLLFNEPVKQLLFGRWLRRRGLMVFRDQSRAKRWFKHLAGEWLMTGVSVGVISYVVSIPLVAYHFGLFSPYAAMLSMLLSPLITFVLVPGYISLALAWPMPNFAFTFGALGAQAARLLALAVDAMKFLPGLCFELRPVPVWWVLLFYVASAAVMYCRRIPWGHTVAVAMVLGLAAATIYTQLPAPAPASAELHVLSVGSGQCVVLRVPSGKTYIIDAGTRSDVEVCQNVLLPFLRAKKFPAPSAAFVSHANTDHYAALAGLAERGELPRLYLNEFFGQGSDGAEESPPVRYLNNLRQQGVEIIRLAAGQTIPLDERTTLEVLWPPSGRKELDSPALLNDTSLALRITCGRHRVLLPGDLGKIGQGELAALPAGAMRSDVLILPHHGGWTDKLPDFFRAVSPVIGVVSNNMEPRVPARGGEAGKRYYARLTHSCRYYSTPRNGWICVHFGGARLDVETMR